MAQVSITINGRAYEVTCDDGQEDHLRRLAELVDKRMAELVAAVGQVGDARLLVLASLMLADELESARQEGDAAESLSAGLATQIAGLADRLEAVAEKHEPA